MNSFAPIRLHSRFISFAFILLIGLLLRLGWCISRPVNDAAINILPDQREYLEIARNVLHGRGFQFFDPRFGGSVFAFRMPGYPLFVAACGANLRVIRIVQAIVDASTVLAVYLLARRLMSGSLSNWGPLVAAALVAFNPYLIYFAGLVLSETLFTAMLAWGMLLLATAKTGGGRISVPWLAGGILLALSVSVRPSAMALPVLLGVVSIFLNRAKPEPYPIAQEPSHVLRRRALLAGAWMGALVLLSLVPWAARNRAVLGRWVWLDTNSGFTLYDAYNPDATGGSDQRFVAADPRLKSMSEAGRSEYLAHRARDYALQHTGRLWDLIWDRMARFWSPAPLSRDFGRRGLRAVALAYSVPFFVLVIVGLIRGRMQGSAKLFLLAPAIYFSVVHALTIGSLRYRIPVEPPMAVIAAMGIACPLSVVRGQLPKASLGQNN